MNIFSKFLNLIKNWFKPSIALPSPSAVNDVEAETTKAITDIDNNEERDIFINELKIQKQEESPELLNLQLQFEGNQIQLTDLTDEQLDNLNDLYQRQIDQLKERINKTKTEININMNKLESTLTSA